MSGWKQGDPLVLGRGQTNTATQEEIVDHDWQEVWHFDNFDGPGRYGVEDRIQASQKTYRAWARFPSDMQLARLESPVYDACDAADFDANDDTNMRPFGRQNLITQSKIARAQMKPNERSPEDMRKIADSLRKQVRQLYTQWQTEQERLARVSVEDETALKSARTLVRGLQLLAESGSTEEKALANKLLGKK